MTPFDGITIVYADNITGHEVFCSVLDLGFSLVMTEDRFHTLPQSQRLEWCENMCEHLLGRDKKLGNTAFLTNDYYLMRMLESFTPEEKLQYYHLDTGETVKKFVDLKPNPRSSTANIFFVQV